MPNKEFSRVMFWVPSFAILSLIGLSNRDWNDSSGLCTPSISQESTPSRRGSSANLAPPSSACVCACTHVHMHITELLDLETTATLNKTIGKKKDEHYFELIVVKLYLLAFLLAQGFN